MDASTGIDDGTGAPGNGPPNPKVAEAIARGDDWFTGSQFEWSYGDARFVHALRERFLRRAIAAVGRGVVERPLRVVEVGCGDAVNLYRIRDLPDVRLYGFDYNPLRIERARKLLPSAHFEVQEHGSSTACPVEGGAHLLIFSHVIEHIEDDVGALSALRGWLAPGGKVALLAPNEGCLFARLGREYFDPWIKEETDHVHFYTARSLKRVAERAGFRLLRLRREVLTFPKYRFHMGFLRRRWGYWFLRGAGCLLPCQTSGLQMLLEPRASERAS